MVKIKFETELNQKQFEKFSEFLEWLKNDNPNQEIKTKTSNICEWLSDYCVHCNTDDCAHHPNFKG